MIVSGAIGLDECAIFVKMHRIVDKNRDHTTFDDYSGSPTQHTNLGWDNVTGPGTPKDGFLSTFGH